MNYFLILLISTITIFSTYAERNISSVYFYTCNLDRESRSPKAFNKEFVFQVTDKKNDITTISKSDRWATAKVSLSGSGELKVIINEQHQDFLHKKEFEFKIKDFSLSTPNSFKAQFFLKAPDEIEYNIDCR